MIRLKRQDRVEFVPDSERGEEKPATFTLKRLASDEQARLMDMAFEYDDAGNPGPSGEFNQACERALKRSLVGWENVVDEDEQEIPFPTKAADAVGMLDPADRISIGGAIIRGRVFAPDELSEDERKN